jgi:ATP:corrinoid adenosyltransferase
MQMQEGIKVLAANSKITLAWGREGRKVGVGKIYQILQWIKSRSKSDKFGQVNMVDTFKLGQGPCVDYLIS